VQKNTFILYSFIYIFCSVFVVACNDNAASTIIEKPNNKPIITPKVEEKKPDTVVTINTWQALKYDTTKTYIYLTFDDGPQPGTTACLDLCKKMGIKATFFMVGNHASSPHLKSLVKDIKNSYPQILLANHSTTHANGRYHYFYEHEKMAEQDFYLAQKTLEVPFKIIRLPGNTSWVKQNFLRSNVLTKPVCKLLDSAGYNVIGWDVEWNFSRKTAYPVESPSKMVRYIENAVKNNDLITKKHVMILTHDRMFRNQNFTDSLAQFISLIKANTNYVFETVDHYPGLKQPL
jgi:peptidoglycan-N-acetylglucosamine deacetylase